MCGKLKQRGHPSTIPRATGQSREAPASSQKCTPWRGVLEAASGAYTPSAASAYAPVLPSPTRKIPGSRGLLRRRGGQVNRIPLLSRESIEFGSIPAAKEGPSDRDVAPHAGRRVLPLTTGFHGSQPGNLGMYTSSFVIPACLFRGEVPNQATRPFSPPKSPTGAAKWTSLSTSSNRNAQGPGVGCKGRNWRALAGRTTLKQATDRPGTPLARRTTDRVPGPALPQNVRKTLS